MLRMKRTFKLKWKGFFIILKQLSVAKICLGFTSASAIDNLWSILLGVDILRGVRSETLAMQTTPAKSKRRPVPWVASKWASDAIFV